MRALYLDLDPTPPSRPHNLFLVSNGAANLTVAVRQPLGDGGVNDPFT